MEGILKQINNNIVQIDSKFYTVAEPKYLPKELNIAVEFSTMPDNPTLIKFIKAKEAGKKTAAIKAEKAEGASEGAKPPYSKPSFQKSSYGKSPAEQETIKRQAIGHMVSRTLIGSALKGTELELEIRRLYKIYQELVG